MAIRINGIQSYTLSQFKGVLQPIEVLALPFTVGYNGYGRVLVQSVDTTFDFMYRLTVILDDLFGPQGTLISKDKKSKLDYKKVGDNYEFSVFDGEANANNVVMTYQQFINFIYAEGFVDIKSAMI